MLINKVKENDKLKSLQSQIIEMHADYEDMKKTRAEAKKQMEAKFSDIGNKMTNTEEIIKEEDKRVSEKLEEFKKTVDNRMNDLKTNIYTDFKIEQDFVRSTFSDHDTKLDLLEKMIKEEREERLRHTEEQLNPIRNQLKNLQFQYESGKSERLKHEKDIYKEIKNEVKNMNSTMEIEKNDRNEKLQILNDDRNKEMNLRDSLFEDYDKKENIRLKKEKNEVFEEMDNRFKQQNEVVDDISKFITVFQGTLKIVGKDV